MEEDQGLLGPQPIPAVVPSAVQVVLFFFATSGTPSVGHISPMYICTRKEKKNIQVRFEYAGWSASQSNHNCG